MLRQSGTQGRFSVGAELRSGEGVHFRVWAPEHRRVGVVFDGSSKTIDLDSQDDGYFAGLATVPAGTRYRFRLDNDPTPYPDPASRFQPDGPHGSSEVIDPAAFAWTDADWPGVKPAGQVIYELHIGTLTAEGTWSAAARELPALKDVGVTVIEVMPVADFPGQFNWGYDGVNLFAPTRLYGRPDDFRAFVNQAHALGLGVILDVVYNHLGPDGNYLAQFSPSYFTSRYKTDWGAAINYDGPDAGPVREFFTANAAHWVSEYHLDGLRFDATQNMYDNSATHILADIAAAARRAAGDRSILLVAENEPQDVRLVRPSSEGGFGLDMIWNDDFHHAARVALTGRREAYYTDYAGSPQEFVSAAKHGFLYQGQWYRWQKKRRGTPVFGLPPEAFITFIENHDQVANSARGLHCHTLTSPGRLRAMTALLLLGPGTPLLFQGQEFAASSPFLFFADHHADLATLVRNGRAEFLSQFPSIAQSGVRAALPDPADPQTFQQCKLIAAERRKNRAVVDLHRDLLRLRHDEPSIRDPRIDGAVIGPDAFVLRFFGPVAGGPDDRLLVVNLGRDLYLRLAPEPLLAPVTGGGWTLQWSSEDPKYGGSGAAEPETADDGWHFLGHSAMLLRPALSDK